MKEVVVAYPRLKRDWAEVGGHALRLRPPGVRGVPDFALFHKQLGSVFTEIKSQHSSDSMIGIDADQIEMLRCIVHFGGCALCLAWCLQTRRWAIFQPSELTVRTRWNQASRFAQGGVELLGALSNVAMGNSVRGSTDRATVSGTVSKH